MKRWCGEGQGSPCKGLTESENTGLSRNRIKRPDVAGWLQEQTTVHFVNWAWLSSKEQGFSTVIFKNQNETTEQYLDISARSCPPATRTSLTARRTGVSALGLLWTRSTPGHVTCSLHSPGENPRSWLFKGVPSTPCYSDVSHLEGNSGCCRILDHNSLGPFLKYRIL